MEVSLLICNCLMTTVLASFNLDIANVSRDGEHFAHIWKSTGFSPTPSNGSITEFLLSQDERLNLALIGSLPNNGITHVRIHWLLDLVTATCSDDDEWMFDFKSMDELLFLLRLNKLSPGFELMGNPSGCFTDWAKHSQHWKSFITQLVRHYMHKFDYDYLSNWRFESLNEPDLKMYNRWNLTATEYFLYLDLSAEVLASFKLSFWGPAGLFKNISHHPLCWGALQRCSTSKCPFQVLSFHKKGGLRASEAVEGGQNLIAELKKQFPRIKNNLFANDEADPLTGWIKPQVWRQDVRYAAAMVQIILGYCKASRQDDFNLAAISNDNGFLSYWPHQWSQRTLFARFQMNNTIPPHIQMFPKPVYSALGMMSLLGDRVTWIKYFPGDPGYTVINTEEGHRRAILLVINNDSLVNETWIPQSMGLRINLILPRLDTTACAGLSVLDNIKTNPEHVWNENGRPDYPDKQLRRKMRQSANANFSRIWITVNQTNFRLNTMISIPSLILINICYSDTPVPGPISDFRYIVINKNEILLLWDDEQVKSKCLQTYVVEYRQKKGRFFIIAGKSHYFQINSFQYDGCKESKRDNCKKKTNVTGDYRVAAIDFWGRSGPYSKVLAVH